MNVKSIIQGPAHLTNTDTQTAAAILLSGMAGYIAEYEPTIRFIFFAGSGVLMFLTLFNKALDTFVRIRKWRKKK